METSTFWSPSANMPLAGRIFAWIARPFLRVPVLIAGKLRPAPIHKIGSHEQSNRLKLHPICRLRARRRTKYREQDK